MHSCQKNKPALLNELISWEAKDLIIWNQFFIATLTNDTVINRKWMSTSTATLWRKITIRAIFVYNEIAII